MSKKACLIALALACSPLSPASAVEVGPPELVEDLKPGPEPSYPQKFLRVGNLAYFLAGESSWGGVWRTDGTAPGTFRVTPEDVPVTGFRGVLGNLMFFGGLSFGESELWRSDGTPSGTYALTTGVVPTEQRHHPSRWGSPVSLAVPELGLFFFSADGLGTGRELWATDGTVAGTRQVADLNPAGSSHPGSMVSFGGKLFFMAASLDSFELWRSDGTPEGTVRVKDLQEERDGVLAVRKAGNRLLVFSRSSDRLLLWGSDGTTAGTELIEDLAGFELSEIVVAGDRVFFATRSEDFSGSLWVSDGTAGGTARVLDGVAGGENSLWELYIHAVGRNVTFGLHEASFGQEPWWSDGTRSGTRRVADICPGECSSGVELAGLYGDRALLSANDGSSGIEPWLTDGTPAGTRRLGDLCPGSCSSHPFAGQDVEGVLVFAVGAVEPDGQELWVSDGTPAGTRAATDFVPETIFPLGRFEGTAVPGRLLFSADDGVHGAELWSLPVGQQNDPQPPAGEWLASSRVPGFRFKVRIAGQTPGRQESACIGETLCVSGALAGRSEVFLRVVGPKPNGYLWPTLVKFSTSLVEVWAEQTATGQIRYYRLEASGQGSTLPGIADRTGFLPAGATLEAMDLPVTEEPPPSGDWIVSEGVPGFRVKARLSSGEETRSVRKEPCIGETLCLSGAVAGRPELFVRVVGPKPNGYLWPTLVRFTTSTVEVWIEQTKSGDVRYYRLEGLPRDSSDLSGFFDRQGFLP